MKNAVFTYNDELIKISVKNEVKNADMSIEAEIMIDDEENFKICKKDGVSVPVNKNCVIDPALLSLINKCI
ncbi:hypothetical protein [Mucilaginibacter arboris]|uniref:Uncharacterized protein n=1 Tax=Mucilaginibacter arboris TaxID=2682090 RepID=A0A7K1SUS6_9SPHI|nr:hypothetical protein [Mucilaginibacter arboris]MVN20988.1 hypothetical protein [Mucilaginibacter arboris]